MSSVSEERKVVPDDEILTVKLSLLGKFGRGDQLLVAAGTVCVTAGWLGPS